jgi:hypothetical protein
MTGRFCEVHGEYAADGVCRWCEPMLPHVDVVTRTNPACPGSQFVRALHDHEAQDWTNYDPRYCHVCGPQASGAEALRDVKAMQGYDWTCGPDVDTSEKLARIANVDVAPPLDAQTILDAMNRAFSRIIRARLQDDAIEATRLVFSPQECGRLLLAEHAALRWERVARRWNYKHRNPRGLNKQERAYVWRCWLAQQQRIFDDGEWLDQMKRRYSR